MRPSSSVALQLTIAAGRGLLAADRGGTSDPYCCVELVVNPPSRPAPNYKQLSQKTHVVKKTLNPTWNTQFSFSSVAPQSEHLCFYVFDHDTFSRDDFLGWVYVPVSALQAAGTYDQWVDLKHPKDASKLAGSIHIIVAYGDGRPPQQAFPSQQYYPQQQGPPSQQYYSQQQAFPSQQYYPQQQGPSPQQYYSQQQAFPSQQYYPQQQGPSSQQYYSQQQGPSSQQYYSQQQGPPSQQYYPQQQGPPSQQYHSQQQGPPSQQYYPQHQGPPSQNYLPPQQQGNAPASTGAPPDPAIQRTAASLNLNAQEVQVAWTAFQQFDTNRSGTLDFEELKKVLQMTLAKRMQQGLLERYVQVEFQSLDADKNGSISFIEFLQIYAKIKTM